MVDLAVDGGNLVLNVRGLDKLWSFKSRLSIPIQHVRGARFDPGVAHGWWKGLRAPGTYIPGVIAAGTFYREEKRIFWDVHDPERTIVIELEDERYDELIVEVKDPEAAVHLIQEQVAAAR